MVFTLPTLMPHQEVVRDFIAARPKCGVFLTMGGGKAQPLDALVLTPTGFIPMRDVRVGTQVVVPDGSTAPVTRLLPQGERPVHTLVLSDGREVDADAEHLWSVTNADDRFAGKASRTMTTRQIAEDLTWGNGDSKWSIEAPAPVDLGAWSSTIDPYVLGVLLGDGSFVQGTPSLINPDPEILEAVRAGLEPLGVRLHKNDGSENEMTYYLTSGGNAAAPNPLTVELRRLGLWGKTSGDKFVPEALLHSSTTDRLALLRGLMDTDGTPNKSAIEFLSKSELLTRDARWLTHSLGGYASTAEKVLGTGPYAGNVYHRMHARLPKGVAPFLLPRKADLVHEMYKGARRSYDTIHLAIREVRAKGSEQVQCIEVDHPAHEYVTDGFVRTHNCLSTLSALAQVRPAGHILVVAPVNIARSTWIDEIEKWGFPLRTRSLIVNDNDKKLTRKKRLERYAEVFDAPPTMYFINVDLIVDLVENMPRENADGVETVLWPFSTVIVDESQTLKGYDSVRFKALASVSEAIVRLIELTGTPTPNGLLDLWSQMFLLDGGLALGRTITEYRERYFEIDKIVENRPVSWKPRPGASEAIYALVAHKVMSAENTSIPMPEVSIDDVPIVLEKDTMEAYKDFAKSMVLDLADPDELAKGTITITADNQAILHGKLIQFASGTMYTDEDKNFAVIHTDKLQMTDYLIRNAGGSPVIVAYKYKSDKKQLTEHLTKAGHHVETFDGSREMTRRWNAGQIPVMLLQPASAGHGVNLQDGGHTFIWYTLPDSLEHYLQANARLARMGQEHPVQIWRLVTKGTRDAKMPMRLAEKQAVQQGLLDAVRHEVYDIDQDLNEILGDLDLSPL